MTVFYIGKLCICTLGEKGIVFEKWAYTRDIKIRSFFVNKNYCMRVSHRNAGDFISGTADVQGVHDYMFVFKIISPFNRLRNRTQ